MTLSENILITNLHKLHTTESGRYRIKKNLNLDVADLVHWCRAKIESPDVGVAKNDKNWYITVDNISITVNAKSYTIITAHKFSCNS
ncbi:MAG: DUF3781 domain-containing protein [Desulfovibrio sp.]|nr:DUF3781 domain-containing protein [Desulfovibrio sp.]